MAHFIASLVCSLVATLVVVGGTAGGLGAQAPRDLARQSLERQSPAPPASTDVTGDIAGAVVDAMTGRAVSGAIVRLEWADSSDAPGGESGEGDEGDEAAMTRTTGTDGEGRYRFAGVPAGPWRLSVTALGYQGNEVWVDLPASWRIRRSVGLAVAPVALSPIDVDVVAIRSLGGGLSMTGIEPSAVTNAVLPARAMALDARVTHPDLMDGMREFGEPDVLRALQRLPGVTGKSDYAAQPWVRGAPWSMTHVLFDGLPLFDPVHLGGMTTGFAAAGLESATLHPGVQPMAVARGAAATLDVKTRRAREDHVEGGLSTLGARLHAEDRWFDSRVGLSVGGRRSWWDLLSGDRDSRKGVNYVLADLSGRADFRISEELTLEAGGLWEEDELSGGVEALVAPARGRWGNTLGWSSLTGSFGGARVSAMAGRVTYRALATPVPRARFLGPDPSPILTPVDVRLDHTVARVIADGTLPSQIAWSAGVETIDERLDQQGDDVSERRLPGEDDDVSARREAVWLETAMPVGPLDVAVGARAETVGSALGSVRVRWNPAEWLSVEAATGTSRQHTYPLAVAGTALGPGLAVAHVWVLADDSVPSLDGHTSTASVAARLPAGLTLSATAWRRNVSGLYLAGVSAVVDGTLRSASSEGVAGRERGHGYEVAVEGVWSRASAHVSYSRGRSDFLSPEDVEWPSPAGRPDSFEFGGRMRVGGGFTAATSLTVESGWPYVDGPSTACAGSADCNAYPNASDSPEIYGVQQTESYASLDVALDWERSTGSVTWALIGAVRNVLGRANPAAWRAGSCEGAELISSACEVTPGLGRVTPGISSPTPSLSLRVVF